MLSLPIVASASACLRLVFLPLMLVVVLTACGGDEGGPGAEPAHTDTAQPVVQSCFPVPPELGEPGPMTEEVVGGMTVATGGGVAYADRDRIIEGLLAAQQFVEKELGGVERLVCVDIRGDDARSGSAITLRNRIIVFTERGGWDRPYPWLLSRAVAHEYIHVWAAEAANDFAIATSPEYGPGWLTEGVAEHLSMRIVLEAGLAPPEEAEAFTRTLLRLSTARLAGLTSLPLPYAEDYATAELAVGRLVEGRGTAAIRQYYENLGKGQPWQAVFERAFGVKPDIFVRQFDAAP